MLHALVVDDHSETLVSLADLVERQGFTTARARSLKEATEEIARHRPDVVLLDLNLPDGDGMELLDTLEPASSPAVVLITGQASVDTAVQALRRGLTDYLTKPIDLARLEAILTDIAGTHGIKTEIAGLRSALATRGRFGMLVGTSERMQAVYEQISRVAPTNATVFITGESGTGKELVARTLHDLSRRRHGPFVALNCGAVSPTLIESELFGHERGSFTGADRRHRGVFEQASRGTLFLDEVTEMPIELQARLLRVLETGSFMRTGGENLLSVDVRFIAATNRDPEEAVRQGRLREDLYYRLRVFHLNLPPLRERVDDVELLAQHFLSQIAETEGDAKRLSPASVALLRTYWWPGNVRELKNAVYTAYIMASGEITTDAFAPEIRRPRAPAASPEHVVPVHVGMRLADAEQRLIVATLSHYDGSKTKTADALGISLKTLYNRLQAYRTESATGRPPS